MIDYSSKFIEQARSKYFQLQERINQTLLKIHTLDLENEQLQLQKQQAQAIIDRYSNEQYNVQDELYSFSLQQEFKMLRKEHKFLQEKIKQLQKSSYLYELQTLQQNNNRIGQQIMASKEVDSKSKINSVKEKIEKYRKLTNQAQVQIALLSSQQNEQIDYITTLRRINKEFDAEIESALKELEQVREVKKGF